MGEKYPALRYSDHMAEDFQNGCLTIKCNSWGEFEDRIAEFTKYKYVWRGQSCIRPLLPNIFRDNTPNGEKIEQHLNQFKKDIPGARTLDQFLGIAKKEGTKEFEEALSEYYNMIHPKADDNNPKENYVKDFIDDIFWAIGQHHGLMTPLLDWTMDPYKALFFAFCERKEGDDKRVVYGLAEKSRLLLKNELPKKRYIELLTDLNFVQKILDSSDSPPVLKGVIRRMFDRINAQNGIFSKSLHIEDVEKHTQRCYTFYKENKNEEIVFLIKILISNGIREDLLEKLEREQITYKTMFPDLYGAALHCNLKL
jgi:hypothetical protein